MEYGDFLQCVQEYAKKETGRGGVVSINHVIKIMAVNWTVWSLWKKENIYRRQFI